MQHRFLISFQYLTLSRDQFEKIKLKHKYENKLKSEHNSIDYKSLTRKQCFHFSKIEKNSYLSRFFIRKTPEAAIQYIKTK